MSFLYYLLFINDFEYENGLTKKFSIHIKFVYEVLFLGISLFSRELLSEKYCGVLNVENV